jgi:hypothetical protein
MPIDPIIINDSFKDFSKLIENIRTRAFRSTHSAAGRPENVGIGERIIDKTFAEQLYGDDKTFMSKYKEFEKLYYEELSDTKNVRRSFVKGLDVDLMRKVGSIDLSILSLDSRKNLESFFAGSVFKIDELFSNAGMPTKQLPSASPYRIPTMFEVDQGLEHPAQVMLNKMIFNIDPTSKSFADVRFGSTNIMSSEDLERNLFQIQKMRTQNAQTGMSELLDFTPNADGSAKRVVTFDVETTGLGSGSQVRSVSLSSKTSLDEMGKTLDSSFGYDSPRLGGILAGRNLSDTLSSFISKGEKTTNIVESEADFLKNMERVLEDLINADQVTGHNVNFDITQMLRTMSGMKGYASNEKLQGLVGTFLEKKQSNKMFVIDTLELGRAYITDKAQKVIAGEVGSDDSVFRGQKYIEKFFSPESLADVATGGKSTYAGVENFVMNTNLLDLMAEERHAPAIFDKIFQGSHIAETDTILQEHILKYMHTGKLDFRDPDKVKDPETAKMLELARRKVFKSAATTAVTNIADPQFLTDTALSFIDEGEGVKGVRAIITGQEAITENLIAKGSDISKISTNQLNEQGFIKFEKGSFRLFSGADKEGIELNEARAKDHLRRLVKEASDQSKNESINFGGKTIGSYNPAENKIMSLGISFQQNASMELMNRFMKIAAATDIDSEKYVENVGNLYKNFADSPDKMHIRDIMRNNGSFEAKQNFSSGLNMGRFGRFGALEVEAQFRSHAQSSLAAGNKYGFLGVQESVISNILSSGTSQVSRGIYEKAIQGGFGDLSQDISKKFAFAASDEIADVTSQFGISSYTKQSTFRLTGQDGGQAKKILLNYDYFKSLKVAGSSLTVGEQIAQGKVAASFSVAERIDDNEMYKTINVFWRAGRDESQLTARTIAENLYKDFIESNDYKNKLSSGMGQVHSQEALADMEIQKAAFHEAYKPKKGLTVAENKERVIAEITKSIEERGVGIASFGDKYNQDVVENMTEGLSRNGMDIANDNAAHASTLQANIIDDAAGDNVTFGHVYDRDVINANKANARLISANQSALADASKVGADLANDPNLLNRAMTNLKSARRQTPLSTAVENYHKFKGPVGIAALGLTALAGGYYIGKRKQETNLYDETLEQQPTESFRQNRSNSFSSPTTSLNSVRRDPLVTAGVVGNLDNRKIGHTQMGNNKYNHLYGG